MAENSGLRILIHGYDPDRERSAAILELGFAPICLIPSMIVVRRINGAIIVYVSGGPDPEDTRYSRVDGEQFTKNDPYEAWERSKDHFARYNVDVADGYVVDSFAGMYHVGGGAFRERGVFSVAFADDRHIADAQMTSDKWDRFLRGHDPADGHLPIL